MGAWLWCLPLPCMMASPVISRSIHTNGSLSLRVAPAAPEGEEGRLLEGSCPASSPASARAENELHELEDAAVVATTALPADSAGPFLLGGISA